MVGKEIALMLSLFGFVFSTLALSIGILSMREKEVIENKDDFDYSWFDERARMIVEITRRLSRESPPSDRYSELSGLLNRKIVEYNMEAVRLIPREKWNGKYLYQYSYIEQLSIADRNRKHGEACEKRNKTGCKGS